jgi:tetratricopeptide (TPR) repeat protein
MTWVIGVNVSLLGYAAAIVQARAWYAFFYLQLAAGRLEEGISQAKLALESDPLSGYANAGVGICYFNAGMYAEALQMFERALELDSDSFLAGYFRFCTLHLTDASRRQWPGRRRS